MNTRFEVLAYGEMSKEIKASIIRNTAALGRAEAYAFTSAGNFFLGRPLNVIEHEDMILLRWDDLDLPDETLVHKIVYLVDCRLLAQVEENVVCSKFYPRLIVSEATNEAV
jgi:hypothetical protein